MVRTFFGPLAHLAFDDAGVHSIASFRQHLGRNFLQEAAEPLLLTARALGHSGNRQRKIFSVSTNDSRRGETSPCWLASTMILRTT